MACFRSASRRLRIIKDCSCGINVISTPNVHCTCICGKITYNTTITNNCIDTMNDAFLHVGLDGILCLDPSSVMVNGEHVEVNSLSNIPLGNIQKNTTTTVTYTVTVMDYKRYIKTRALVSFYTCCCCSRQDIGVLSNCNLVQVCRCCCPSAASN